MPRLSGKVAFVTGASAGIGLACAEVLAREGAKVVLAARRQDRLEALAQKLTSQGSEAIAVACDVTIDDSVRAAIQATLDRFGQLDLVLANAGFGVAGSVQKLTLEDYRNQLETNLYGVIRTAQTSIPHLLATRGRLGIVGSVNGYLALPKGSAYAISKFAVRGFTESLYQELRPKGVSVTHIAPGFVESEIRKVDNRGRLHEDHKDSVPSWIQVPAEAAAKEMVSAMIKRRREVIVTGHGKVAVSLARHFPGLVSFVIGRTQIAPAERPKKD